MTYKEKKAFLSSYIHAENALKASLAEYERWETIGTKVNRIFSAAPGSGSGSTDANGKVERAAVEMASIMEGIQANIDDAKRTKAEVIAAINKVPRMRHRELLRYRYICRMSNTKIAEMIGKDVKTVEKVIKTAIYYFNP